MQTKHDANLYFFISDANAFYQDADAKYPYDAHVLLSEMQFHDANVLCRDEDMKFIHDGASARIYPWCKCLLVGMPWCKCSCMYVMMQMPPCGYAMMQMFMYVCHDVNVHVCMSCYGMLWCKHNLFKNSFYSQNEASTTPETKIFSHLIYYSWKVIFLLT